MKKTKVLLLILFFVQSISANAQQQDIDQAITDAKNAENSLSNTSPVRSTTAPATNVQDSELDSASDGAVVNQNKLQSVDVRKKSIIVTPKSKSGTRLSEEETKAFRSQLRSLKTRPDLMNELGLIDKNAKVEATKKFNPIYEPNMVSPDSNKDKPYLMERDSSKIISKRMSETDSLNLYMCYTGGVSITLDSSISSTFQRVIIDDQIFFSALAHENERGVYVRLKNEIPEGKYYETAIRLVRKSDDKSYLVNLFGVACPAGDNPYPKVVYIKDKVAAGDAIGANNRLLTPEDLIIDVSKGYPRVNKNRIRAYDMVTSAGSSWVVFGVEVQFPNLKKDTIAPTFAVLDNLQFNKIRTKAQYLKVQSEKVTGARGVPTARFKLSVNIDKEYILNNRYIYMMYLDDENKHYQYIKIDTDGYFKNLKNRGFNL